MAEKLKIVFDTALMRPACALLQAVKGGTPGIASRFPSESWLIDPTDNMKLYAVSEAQLQILINRVRAMAIHRKNL